MARTPTSNQIVGRTNEEAALASVRLILEAKKAEAQRERFAAQEWIEIESENNGDPEYWREEAALADAKVRLLEKLLATLV